MLCLKDVIIEFAVIDLEVPVIFANDYAAWVAGAK